MSKESGVCLLAHWACGTYEVVGVANVKEQEFERR